MSCAWVNDCISHWSATISEMDIGVDWCDAKTRCWRCGSERKLQKCHIVAKQFGGSDSFENLVPLCAECHDEAPDVTDSSEMWRWIKETRPQCYGTLKLERAFAICLSRGVDLLKFDNHKFQSAMEQHVGLHLMQNGAGCRIKASSIAWAIERACSTEDLNGR